MSDSIHNWRRHTRADLLVKRAALSRESVANHRDRICDAIRIHFPALASESIGFYWPIKGEVDLRDLVTDLIASGADAALPVVVEKQQPLEFWRWRPDTSMSRGTWNIPVPANPDIVLPTVMLIPLLGFDGHGYRLGYGGGFYDRTLAALSPKPLTIGVGYEQGRLDSIDPQAHDIPLDAIVTETGFMFFDSS